MDRVAWWAAVHGVTRSRTRLKGLSTQGAEKSEQIETGGLVPLPAALSPQRAVTIPRTPPFITEHRLGSTSQERQATRPIRELKLL